ncbi:MAG TPA: hypothetical protein VK468_02355 [Pyrinomonadaceae bacterium]|nr:hypothetical protein [Pyrinomonadaceae bacterium]
MQWAFTRFRDPDYFRVTNTGIFMVADLERLLAEIPAAPEWEHHLPILFDNRDLDMNEGDFAEMRKASEVLIRHIDLFGCPRIASLMGTPGDFGRSRQIISMTEAKASTAVNTFYDECEALTWLLSGPGEPDPEPTVSLNTAESDH